MTETTVRGSGECDASSEARLPDALAASLAALGAASVDGLGEGLRIRDQHARCLLVVLGLTDQVVGEVDGIS